MSIDTCATLRADRGPKAARRSSLRAAFCLMAIALTFGPDSMVTKASANQLENHPDNLKLYALKKMGWDQFECYNWLIRKESSWNPLARNGSHYGLAQMRNYKVAGLDGRAQIRWHIRYLKHRYPKHRACGALRHFESKGWH
jgi:hypothetical protein